MESFLIDYRLRELYSTHINRTKLSLEYKDKQFQTAAE